MKKKKKRTKHNLCTFLKSILAHYICSVDVKSAVLIKIVGQACVCGLYVVALPILSRATQLFMSLSVKDRLIKRLANSIHCQCLYNGLNIPSRPAASIGTSVILTLQSETYKALFNI